MSHDHSHHHIGFEPTNKKLSQIFLLGITLNGLFVVFEFLFGLYYNSLSLIADAGHNLSDVVSLLLAFLAFRLSKLEKVKNFTYGYQKSTILVALINAVLLVYVVIQIIWEAALRINTPATVEGDIVALVALVGILINGATALLFIREKDKDLNLKGAYLHMLADTLVSFAVLIGGIVIYFTQIYWIDSLLSVCVAIFIIITTWKLLKDSVKLSLDGVPEGIEIEAVKNEALKVKGVLNIHHIHIWAISTTKNAITAHVVVENYQDAERIKHELKHAWEHLNIQHSTIEFERTHCEDNQC